LNSNFSAALFGALAGAYGARAIARRQARREALANDMRRLNAAIAYAHNTCAAYLDFKKHHTRDLHKRFVHQKEQLKSYLDRKAAGALKEGEVFRLSADLQNLAIVNAPHEPLRSHVFDTGPPDSRILAFMALLSQAIHNLDTSVTQRNELIQLHKSKGAVQGDQFVKWYFGLEGSGGGDLAYSNLVDAIAKHTDDCIFYSKKLCDVMTEHGRTLERTTGRSLRMVPVDFKAAESDGLIPKDTEYYDVMSGLGKTKFI
jgi:hypothetical protein